MTGNFTLTTLIAILQSELNWHALNYTKLEKDVTEMVAKAFSGELDEHKFDSYYNSFTRWQSNGRNNHRSRFRHQLYHMLHLNPPDLNSTLEDIHSINTHYRDISPNTKGTCNRLIDEILSISDLTFLARFHRKYNVPENERAPWENDYSRFDMLKYICDMAVTKYPYGLQILHEEPRLTDEYSAELYREADEIIGALEKFNSDPKYASTTGSYQMGHQFYYVNFDKMQNNMTDKLRQQLDGNDRTDDSMVDIGFDDEEDGVPGHRRHTMESNIVSQLTSSYNVQAVLKAIISALHTRHNQATSHTLNRHKLTVMRPGYWVDLNTDIVNALYADEITIDKINKLFESTAYYFFDKPQVTINNDNNLRGVHTDARINNVTKGQFDSDRYYTLQSALISIPMVNALDQEVNLDVAFKSGGQLPGMGDSYRGTFYDLIRSIVFTSGKGTTVTWRRPVTRIKNVPLRKVWELPLIINPLRTVEEIFADLGYELHEKTEPHAKAEAPVRKPGSKRK